MTIENVKHTDVREKTQLYIRVTNKKGKNYLINVGEKTYKAIQQLEIDENTNEEKKEEKVKK